VWRRPQGLARQKQKPVRQNMNPQNNGAIANRKIAGVRTAYVLQIIFACVCAFVTVALIDTAVSPEFWEPDTTATDFYVPAVIFAILTLFLVWRAVLNHRLKKYYRLLLPIIASERSGSIDAIARSLSQPPGLVRKYLEKMIKKAIFNNAYIDYDRNAIVFTDITGVVSGTAQTSLGYVSKICPGCGAPNNVPVGGHVICAYCGKALS
jgi:hypothetical protein